MNAGLCWLILSSATRLAFNDRVAATFLHLLRSTSRAAAKVFAKYILYIQTIYSSVPQVDAVAEGVTKHIGHASDVSVPQVGYKTHKFQIPDILFVNSASRRRRRKCYKALGSLSTTARFFHSASSGCRRSGYKTHTPDSLFVTVPQVDAVAEVVPKHIAQAGDLGIQQV